ncbi:MAG: hypothetical protein OSA87_06150 [Woeseiaceae bacterium]|nr:hypothetical protein [Woeseiaceae bacterium]
MKNLLLILLLANILYFMWGYFVDEESEPGVAFVEESDLGPPLDVSVGWDSDSIVSVGAVLGSEESSALEALFGHSCVTIGPFKENANADLAALEYANEGMRSVLRPTRAQVFVGHWVWIRNIESEIAADTVLQQLKDGGLNDVYLDRSDPADLKISLGLFGAEAGAEKIELQARSLDLPAEIIPSSKERDVFFVDIELPPGKGAGAMIEKHGQERVLTREAATCP